MKLFKDRIDAGRTLAEQLGRYAGRDDVTVLALPRGWVPVGFEVAKALNAPLDVFLVRKMDLPGREELAMGAVSSATSRPQKSIKRQYRLRVEWSAMLSHREPSKDDLRRLVMLICPRPKIGAPARLGISQASITFTSLSFGSSS